jgi:serine protease Do
MRTLITYWIAVAVAASSFAGVALKAQEPIDAASPPNDASTDIDDPEAPPAPEIKRPLKQVPESPKPENANTESHDEPESAAMAVDARGVRAYSPETHARALSLAFRESASKTLPAVVTVFSRTKRPEDSTSVLDILSGGSDNPDSVGSGVIVSPDGWILTNHHVIADSSRVEVRLPDGRRFVAEDQKSDPPSDVALLRINVKGDLKYAELGSSAQMQVGDWVLAIGSPFTLESSVSAGIISGTNRRQQLSPLVGGQFLQTDAAINPGNSGGPLIDLDGKVIGINTAISSRSGGFQGIGFAIPIDRAVWIKRELMKYGKVRRAYAGVRLSDVPYELAQSLELPFGALVSSVTPRYPGDLAGLKSGDVVVEFDGQAVRSKDDFQELIQQSPVGDALRLKIIRAGEPLELSIELVERPQ